MSTLEQTIGRANSAPGPDGQMLYTWDTEEHHVELELFPDGTAEWFYRNRTTGLIAMPLNTPGVQTP